MMRPLNSDQLGNKGQLEFETLCNDAGLICNSSAKRDRAGWDFIVEFPFLPPVPGQALDQRPQPPEYRIQVKTVWSETKSVKLRLSSAERIAKILQASCIFVITVDNKKSCQELYCIHIIDDVLEQILKAVRECSRAESIKINKKFIALNYKVYGEKIDITPDAVRCSLLRLNGDDQRAYIERKQNQVQNLGAIPNRYKATFTIKSRNERELLDVMLGLKKGRVLDVVATETRWGVTLPIPEISGPGEILLKKTPIDGALILRNNSIKETIRINVDLNFASSPIRDGRIFKVHASNKVIELEIEQVSDKIFIKLRPQKNDMLLLSEHIKLNRIQSILSADGTSIELHAGGKKVFSQSLTAMVSDQSHLAFQANNEILKKMQNIAESAGQVDFRFSHTHVNEQMVTIDFLHATIVDPKSVSLGEFRIKADGIFPDQPFEQEALIIGRLSFSEVEMVFCAIGKMTSTVDGAFRQIDVSNVHLREVAVINPEQSSFEDFQKDMESETALSCVLKLGELLYQEANVIEEDIGE